MRKNDLAEVWSFLDKEFLGTDHDADTASYAFDSRPINSVLRAVPGCAGSEPALRAALSISGRMRHLSRSLRLFRAIDFCPLFGTNDVDRLLDCVLTDRGFMSMNPDPLAAERFRFAGQVVAIDVPAGTRALYLRSELVPERPDQVPEVVLDAGTTVRLGSTDREGRLVAVVVGQSAYSIGPASDV